MPKAISEKLTRLNEFGKRMVESPLMSIMVLDKRGTIVLVNKEFRHLSGSRSPLGRNVFQIPFFKRHGLYDAYHRLLEKGMPVKKEGCDTVNRAGETKYLNIVAVPLRNEAGRIDGALSMAVDVTQTIVATLELKKLNSALEKRVAERTEQLLGFIADASHELRTPLSIMKMGLEMGEKDSKTTLAAIGDEVVRIEEILEDLNLLIAIDGGHATLKLEKVNLHALLATTIKRLQPLAAEKKIALQLRESGRKGGLIKADKVKLEKLFVNVLRNAIKYGKKGGWIKIGIAAEKKTGMAEVVIADNGIGIPPEDLPHIFDRFYRSTLSRRKNVGGFGLGLSICKWITEEHNGSITATSEVGKGSAFTIILPINNPA